MFIEEIGLKWGKINPTVQQLCTECFVEVPGEVKKEIN
jgi:hypothetical protein